jgi:uncharacterized lipoprotein YbaY
MFSARTAIDPSGQEKPHQFRLPFNASLIEDAHHVGAHLSSVAKDKFRLQQGER